MLSPILTSRPARFIALVSYSIYLSHGRPLFYVAKLAERLRLQGWPRFAFVVADGVTTAVAAGALLYYTVERPGMQLRDRLFPRA